MISGLLRKVWMAVAVIPAAVVAACDQGPSVVVNFTLGANVWDNFVYAAAKGPVLVEIHCNPVAPRPIEDLAGMVVEEMKSAVLGIDVAFTVYPEEAATPDSRVIAVFDGAKTQSGNKLCAGAAPDAVEPQADRITLRLVYCSDAARMADVQGWIKREDPADDQRLRKLIWYAGNTLLQNESEH